ncbi:hypothetical protein CASFOL_020612 [Castilleja foliolosa]|uniref:Uncharacterized protein n=1 Tax=Castilleja foliolosa TaxID=1961234 RepID=A0ABD3D1C7_9LAMI
MPKKNSAHLQKLPILLKFYIFLAKFKRPIIPNYLTFLKKMKKMKLLKKSRHSHYGYVKEYELQFCRNNFGKQSFRKLYSEFLLFSKCLGGLRGGDKKDDQLYCLEFEVESDDDDVGSRDLTAAIDLWKYESVDERAERFIQRFYEDMRKQRQEIQFTDEWI